MESADRRHLTIDGKTGVTAGKDCSAWRQWNVGKAALLIWRWRNAPLGLNEALTRSGDKKVFFKAAFPPSFTGNFSRRWIRSWWSEGVGVCPRRCFQIRLTTNGRVKDPISFLKFLPLAAPDQHLVFRREVVLDDLDHKYRSVLIHGHEMHVWRTPDCPTQCELHSFQVLSRASLRY